MLTFGRLFVVAISMTTIYLAQMNHATALSGHPDFTTKTAISEICVFIPGVSASLVSFLIFGTTKSWRQYRDLVVSCCGLRRKRRNESDTSPASPAKVDGFRLQELPSLNKSESEKEREKKQEAENRIKMFVREMHSPATVSTNFSTTLRQTNSQSPLIHSFEIARTERPHGRGVSWDMEMREGVSEDDIVVQYEQKKEPVEGVKWANARYVRSSLLRHDVSILLFQC